MRARESEILRLRDATKNLTTQQNNLNSVGSSRRQSRNSNNSSSMETEDLRNQLDDRDHQIKVII